ncbi:MAG: efflux RND transporter periplasmic adaptor subunit [Candidatus Kapaibacterium sp.]
MRKKIVYAALVIGIIAAGFGVQQLFKSMKKEKPADRVISQIKYVNTDTVHYSDHEALITAYGRLLSASKTDVFTEVTGRVASTGFKTGRYYSEGDLIIKIDDEEAKNRLKTLKSDLLNIVTSIMPDLKADYPEGFDKWETFLNNFEIDSKLPEIPEPSSKKEKYFLASRNIYKMYYNTENAQIALEKHSIEAPFNATVTASMVEKGMMVAPQQRLGSLAGTDSYELELALGPEDAEFVSIGDAATITNQQSGKSWQARVARKSNHVDMNTQTIPVYLAASGPGLMDGMYMKAEITGEKVVHAFKLPREALLEGNYVNIIGDNNELVRKKTDPVRFSEKYTYIKGLEPGAIVITEQMLNVAEGTEVKQIGDQ